MKKFIILFLLISTKALSYYPCKGGKYAGAEAIYQFCKDVCKDTEEDDYPHCSKLSVKTNHHHYVCAHNRQEGGGISLDPCGNNNHKELDSGQWCIEIFNGKKHPGDDELCGSKPLEKI